MGAWIVPFEWLNKPSEEKSQKWINNLVRARRLLGTSQLLQPSFKAISRNSSHMRYSLRLACPYRIANDYAKKEINALVELLDLVVTWNICKLHKEQRLVKALFSGNFQLFEPTSATPLEVRCWQQLIVRYSKIRQERVSVHIDSSIWQYSL